MNKSWLGVAIAAMVLPAFATCRAQAAPTERHSDGKIEYLIRGDTMTLIFAPRPDGKERPHGDTAVYVLRGDSGVVLQRGGAKPISRRAVRLLRGLLDVTIRGEKWNREHGDATTSMH